MSPQRDRSEVLERLRGEGPEGAEMADMAGWLYGVLADMESNAPWVHAVGCELPLPARSAVSPCTCGWTAQLRTDAAATREMLDSVVYRLWMAEDVKWVLLRLLDRFAGQPGYREEWRS